MVLAVCRYNLRDSQAAEDAAQETFLSAHRSLLGGTEPRDPAAWLATIARNECRRVSRTVRPAQLAEETTGTHLDPADIVAGRSELSAVAGAIAELPARQREALILREFCGLSYEQVAVAMSVSGAAVDSLLSRARRRLVEQLGDIPQAAAGAFVVPATLREELSRLVPGLDAAGTATGVGAGAGGAAALAGLGSAPAAVKVAATCAATAALAVPIQGTLRGDDGARPADGPPAAMNEPARARPAPARLLSDASPAAPRAGTEGSESADGGGEGDEGSSGPGSGSDSSGSGSGGSGSTSSGSGSDSSGPGSGDSGSDSSGSGSSGSGSDSSGSDSSGSGSGSSGSDSTSSGSSGSGSGSGSSGSGSSGSGSGSSDDE
jgi:RNA polymerase sigma factor (sigma-70 family)